MNETRQWALSVHEKAERVEFYLDVNLTTGDARWWLADPEGEVHWEGTAVSGRRVRETRRYDPLEGEWTLTLAMEEAGGRYEWMWTSSWVNR